MSVESMLRERLQGVIGPQRRFLLWCKLAACWAGAAVVGLVLIAVQRQSGWGSALALPSVLLIGLAAAVILVMRHRRYEPDWHVLASQIEVIHRDLDGRLLTAVEHCMAGGRLNYLQERLVLETLQHSRNRNWTETVPKSRLRLAQGAHWLAVFLLLLTLSGLRTTGGHHLLAKIVESQVNVTPGDISLEKGRSLVVLAQFTGPLPSSVELVLGDDSLSTRIPLVKSLSDPLFGGSVPEVGSNLVYHVEYSGERTRNFHVAVFEHPRLERADLDVTYPEYTGQTNKHTDNTRRLSAVEGSRVDLTLKLNKPVASARLVSRDKDRNAISLTVEAGQPAAALKQFNLDASKAYDLQLVDAEGRTNKVSAQFVFDVLKNRPPELRLTSPRGDQRPSPIEEISFEGTVFDDFGVKAFGIGYTVAGQDLVYVGLGSNAPAKEKRSFQHFLRLEDLNLQPDQLVSWFAWADDIGPDGQLRRTTSDLFFGEIRPFEEVFREAQGMEGGQEAGNDPQQQQQQDGQQGGQQNRQGRLTDLQKQIITATWKLQQERVSPPDRNAAPPVRGTRGGRGARGQAALPGASGLLADFHFASVVVQVAGQPAPNAGRGRGAGGRGGGGRSMGPAINTSGNFEEDVGVVHDSQAQALNQAQTSMEDQQDARTIALWQAATKEMEKALANLKAATNAPGSLKDALTAEQAAYQSLLRLQEHEYQVSRSRNASRGQQSSRNQMMQRQLDQMDLSQSENRYETQRQAQRQQQPTQRNEQLQAMNRLQDLARRQQDLNDRLREMQTELQEARTQQQREEIQRRLKRLEEEEQQMLSDVDELRQRMDRPENQSQMANERQQLDQTREDVQRAQEAAAQGSASQALAAGTRAQRQLQQIRDQMRRENSSQFAEDVREMRNQAREMSRQQENILNQMAQATTNNQRSLSDSPARREALDQLAKQQERMTNLVARATQVSEQAEEAEPLLSRQLYDTVRKFTQDTSKDAKETEQDLIDRRLMTRSLYDRLKELSDQDGAKLEEITSEMFRLGFAPQATQAAQRARTGIDDLKRGVERAAESVIGDDTEALRLAQQELNQLTEQLQQEIARGQGQRAGTNQTLGASARAGEGLDATNRAWGTGELAMAQSPGQRGGQPGERGGQPGQRQGQPGQRGGEGTDAQQAGNPQSGDQETASNDGQRGQGQPGQRGQGQRGGGRSGDGSQLAENQQPGQRGGGARGGDARGRGDLTQADRSGRAGGPLRDGAPDGGQRGGDWMNAGPIGGGIGGTYWDRTLDPELWRQYAPLTGEDFIAWSDRLREVEEMIDSPEWRNDVAVARERARVLRQEVKRDLKKPDWAVVQLQVVKPLLEVRDRIADELARRGSNEALVPIDRDPVPTRYSELVRRYYEELGKDK